MFPYHGLLLSSTGACSSEHFFGGGTGVSYDVWRHSLQSAETVLIALSLVYERNDRSRFDGHGLNVYLFFKRDFLP